MNANRINNRRGVTLLFVISMIVLFLLMGTTFVVIANDFLRSSRRQNLSRTKTIESQGENRGERFINQALFELIRGPDLNNTNSPLRTQCILADMYGYGLSSYVKNVENMMIQPGVGTNPVNNPQFIRLELIAPNIDLYDTGTSVTLGAFDPSADVFASDILTGKQVTYNDIGNAPGRFNGQIITFVSGPAGGVSTRIIDHQVFNSGGTLRHKFVVMLLDPPAEITTDRINDGMGNTNDLVVSLDEVQANGINDTRFPTRVIINNRPFSGTGAGRFNPRATGNIPALSNLALRPNQKHKTREQLYKDRDDNTDGYIGLGDGTDDSLPNRIATNECYDAVDFQNMFLAGRDQAGEVSVPSFHRPNLGILANNMPGFSFRPEFVPVNTSAPYGALRSTTACSSNFPGVIRTVNNMDEATPFNARMPEVDNDNSGSNEGIWMDLGYPIYTNVDGRRIKPLISFTVVDLDPNININVHGNRAQITGNNRFARSTISGGFLAESNTVPFGMGLGPAEIYLGAMVGDSEAERLMVGQFMPGPGMPVQIEVGRYGLSENSLRRDSGGGPVPGIGYVNDANLGQEPFSAYKLFGYPNWGLDPNSLSVLGGFFQSSPLDIYGRFRIGYPSLPFNAALPFQTSMPVIDVTESRLNYSELINNPYEVDFSPRAAASSFYDRLFTLEEIEAVYRQNDGDVRLRPQGRLARLAPSLSAPINRLNVTTDSWEVPTTFHEFMGDLTGMDAANPARLETLMTKLHRVLSIGNNPNYGISEPDPMIKERIIYENLTGFTPLANDSFAIDLEQKSMLSADVRSGRPFNVNQPFGDGLDDDNDDDLVIDNNGEIDVLGHPDANINGLSFDHDNDGFIAGNGIFARQQFARQLYVLALLATELVDRNGNGSVIDNQDFFNFVDPITGMPLTGQNARRAYRKMIAQWAINVVDFRDPDSTMTPFEVDLNPWNGWDVDGILEPNDTDGLPPVEYLVVWGSERPEVLITESMILHDRRVEDRDDDNGGMDELMDGDVDMDSRLVPNASAFFELYHPWVNTDESTPPAPKFPNQFLPAEYDPNQDGGVNLQQLAPNGAPVWRMVVANNALFGGSGALFDSSNSFDFTSDPDESQGNNLSDASIRRIVYFEAPTGINNVQFNGPKVYAPPAGVVNDAILRPGNYALAGSAGMRDGNLFTTYLGRQTLAIEGSAASLLLDETRRIELNTGNNTISIYRGEMAELENSQSAIILPLSGVAPANANRSFGVTDPIDGYGDGVNRFLMPLVPEGDGFFFADSTGLPLVLDEPIDRTLDVFPDKRFYDQLLDKDQLSSGVFVILLQRLANPLAPWDATINPYRTVDSTGADLFAFNGVDSQPMNNGPSPLHLGTFERRSNQDAGANHGQANNLLRSRMLWKTDYSGLNPTADTPLAGGSHYLNTELVESFGRLNQAYVLPNGSTVPNPQIPFAWLTWNNRPYASALELANVPFTSSYFLTSRFDVSLKSFGLMGDIYTPPMPAAGEFAIRTTPQSGEFPHLLNFHADTDNGNNRALQLHRIFDYVEVPSRYLGTETYLNPEQFISTANMPANVRHSTAQGFAPPFDYVSNYRVPGKININTVSSANVWNALMALDPMNMNPDRASFDDWMNSRDNWSSMDRPNPYRVANSRNLVPMNPAIPVPEQADLGLFRRQTNGVNDPLFDYDPMTDTFGTADRNAYFRNNDRQRLGNLVTMRSSVFAIWITVGYFEVESVDALDENDNPVKIDVLGAEVEDLNGLTERNRGFFIFDRSIPVAFEPGKNHNIERAIRVSSYIE